MPKTIQVPYKEVGNIKPHNDLKGDTIKFLAELGIDNYSFDENDSLSIPQGWKGKYNKPDRALDPNEQIIIDWIETWG